MRNLILATIFLLAPALAVLAGPLSASPTVAGEVRKVDKETGKLTLKHAPIPNLDMPDMTMVFRVADPAMLERVKAGDKVRFAADKVGGQYTSSGSNRRNDNGRVLHGPGRGR